MKIRHKQSGVELEGEFVSMGECSGGTARNYFVHAASINGSEYSMTEWEAVEPMWVDVTAECGVTKDGLTIEHGMLALATVLSTERYRIRKVKGPLTVNAQWPVAFIIEQRQA